MKIPRGASWIAAGLALCVVAAVLHAEPPPEPFEVFAYTTPDGHEGLACGLNYQVTNTRTRLIELLPCADVFRNGFEEPPAPAAAAEQAPPSGGEGV
jgi:hypothetical protein